MREVTELSEDGRIVRIDNVCWSYYKNTELESELDRDKCGKWMHYFTDIGFAEYICRKAVFEGVVTECKHTGPDVLEGEERGVICFYLNSDDEAAHRRVLAFMLENGLIRKTKAGKLYDIGFKLDEQTRAGEYGSKFSAKISLRDFVNLETGEFLQRGAEGLLDASRKPE